MTRDEMQTRWLNRREIFSSSGACVDGVRIIDQFFGDLASVEEIESDRILTLREAAARTGYSVDHLARLIRQGKLSNAGRHKAPRIRVGDLPQRRQFARKRSSAYSVVTDAQALRNGRQ